MQNTPDMAVAPGCHPGPHQNTPDPCERQAMTQDNTSPGLRYVVTTPVTTYARMKASVEATVRAARAEREAMRAILAPLGLAPGTDAARAALSVLPPTDTMAIVLAGAETS